MQNTDLIEKLQNILNKAMLVGFIMLFASSVHHVKFLDI